MSRYTVQGEYLCEYVDHCTCGMGRGGYYGAHEPGCGLEPVGPIAQVVDGYAAAQPAPSVPAGAEVAEVLAGLVEEMSRRWRDHPNERGWVRNTWDDAIILVQIAQDKAATGARAAGGESADPHGGYTCAEIEAFSDNAMGDINAVSEVLGRRGHKVDLREHSIDHWVIEALKRAAAPPAPVTPGVAELLAGLVEEMEAVASEWDLMLVSDVAPSAMRKAISLVEAAQRRIEGGDVSDGTSDSAECRINIRQTNEAAGPWLWECMTCRDEYGNHSGREEAEQAALSHIRNMAEARREEAEWKARHP